MKRHRDAIGIQAGAGNPFGIVRSLQQALEETRLDPRCQATEQVCRDPAIRLIVHQLAFICGISEIDRSPECYPALVRACEAEADLRAPSESAAA